MLRLAWRERTDDHRRRFENARLEAFDFALARRLASPIALRLPRAKKK
jgi:hypothetical protein